MKPQGIVFTTAVPLGIYPFHRYPKHSIPLEPIHSPISKEHPRLTRAFTPWFTKPPTYPLCPINPMNTRPACLTAAAGTRLSQGLTLVDHYLLTSLWSLQSMTFILHVVSHGQTCVHCQCLCTAAPIRGLGCSHSQCGRPLFQAS